MTSDPKSPTLSVVTVTWNQREDIGGFLDAIRKAQSRCAFPIEMILVDNASSDGTPSFVRENHPTVRLIENATNTGFAPGCNAGLKIARGEFLLLLNPDAYVNTEALEGMVAFLRNYPRAGAVGCTLLHEDGQPQISAYPPVSAFSYLMNQSMLYPIIEKFRKMALRLTAGGSATPKSVGYLMGACIMVPRTVYQEVGGLEPSYFMYSEDSDWCERIRRAGWQVVHHPGYRILHRQKGSSRRAAEFTFRRLYRSVVHYANRNLDEESRRALMAVMLADMVLRVPVYTLLGLFNPARRERVRSVRRLIAIVRARNPDLFDDPPPQ